MNTPAIFWKPFVVSYTAASKTQRVREVPQCDQSIEALRERLYFHEKGTEERRGKAVAMGKAKKSRSVRVKFAQTKRLLSPKDCRLKGNMDKEEVKRKKVRSEVRHHGRQSGHGAHEITQLPVHVSVALSRTAVRCCSYITHDEPVDIKMSLGHPLAH